MEIRFLIAAIRRYRWFVVYATVIGLVFAIALAHNKAATYEARASLTVTQPDLSTLLGQGSQEDPNRYVANQIGIIQSGVIASQVAAKLPGTTEGSVASAVTVSQRGTSDIVDILAKTTSSSRAVDLANLMANTYLSNEASQLTSLLQQQATKLQAQANSVQNQIDALPTAALSGARGGALENQYTQVITSLNQVNLTLGLLPASTSLFDKATLPAYVLPRKVIEKAILGAAGGLLIGIVLAVVVAASRPRLFRAVDVEDSLGLPVVAELPWVSKRSDVDSSPEFANEVLKACVFIVAAKARGSRKTVLVTSAESTAGVSTVARSLARLLQQSAHTVELVAVREPLSTVIPSSNGHTEAESAAGLRPVAVFPVGRGGEAERGVPLMELVEPTPEVLGYADRLTTLPVQGEVDYPSPSSTALKMGEIIGSGPGVSRDLVVFDGGSLRGSAATISLAQSVDVIVLVVPLPSDNERDMATLLRTVLAQAPAQLVVVAKRRQG